MTQATSTDGARVTFTVDASNVPHTTSKPYLNPTEYASQSPGGLRTTLAIGTVIRVGYRDEEVTIAGFDAFEKHDAFGEPTGEQIPYAYAIWDHDDTPHLADSGEFHAWCNAEGIEDPAAFLKTAKGAKQWLTQSYRKGDRRPFVIGAGAFNAALIGGQWIPVVRETVRTQVQPVLGWAVNGHKTSFKGADQDRGHRQTRGENGRWAAETVEEDGTRITRKRWTTTLRVEALEALERVSRETGLHRNEVVERLIAEHL